MDERIEKLVLNLKSDFRFKVLRNEYPWGFWASGGVTYDEYTELESKNLNIVYVKEILLGTVFGNEITVTNKRENVYAFCNSRYIDTKFKDKPIKNTKFHIDELKDYIDKNA